jgi:enoyl-CoA hydratase/carnithine racemase
MHSLPRDRTCGLPWNNHFPKQASNISGRMMQSGETALFKVEYSLDGAVGWMRLVNPPHNLLDDPVFTDENELRAFMEQDAMKALIITGAGRHFCAGADLELLKAQSKNIQELYHRLERGKRLLEIIRFAPVPVCTLIRGSCLGAGLEIALSCHFRYAAESALIGFPESDQGIMPGLGGTVDSADVCSRSSVIDLVVSGNLVGAQEACRRGLVDKVEPVTGIEPSVLAYIDRLVGQRSPRQIRSIMTSIHNASRIGREAALRKETELFCRLAQEL